MEFFYHERRERHEKYLCHIPGSRFFNGFEDENEDEPLIAFFRAGVEYISKFGVGASFGFKAFQALV
jgi:hypothetical protein